MADTVLERNFVQASNEGRIEDVKRFIEEGVDVNFQVAGWTALMEAVSGDHIDIINVLLEAGVNLELITTHGLTAFKLAIDTNKIEIANILAKF